jgi:hypothetical protein
MLVLFIASLSACVLSAGVLNVLHFRMKFRLEAAGHPVKCFMMPADDLRMWRTYKSEASARGWPIWPFYAYWVLLILFGASGIVCCLTLGRH